jgi:hypothetical protein
VTNFPLNLSLYLAFIQIEILAFFETAYGQIWPFLFLGGLTILRSREIERKRERYGWKGGIKVGERERE